MPIRENNLLKQAKAMTFYIILFFVGILMVQHFVGINVLIKREEMDVFVYQGDIVLSATNREKLNGGESVFKEQYCTYWSGLEKNVFASTDINRGQKGLDCPLIFLNR